MSSYTNNKSKEEILFNSLNIALNIIDYIEDNLNINNEEKKILENDNIERCKKRFLSINNMLDKPEIKNFLINNNELYELVVDTNTKLEDLIKLHK